MIGIVSIIFPAVALITVLVWGSRDLKIVTVTIFVGSQMTALIYRNTGRNWLEPSPLMAINELAITSIILWIAFRSNRFWPLPIAAMQLIALGAHFVTYFTEDVKSYALGVLQGVWSWPQLTIILIAVWRHRQRMKSPRQEPSGN